MNVPRLSRMEAGDERRLRVSFEFFPPKTAEMEQSLWESIRRLAPLKPNFVSVTYGAGGSTRERTHATVKRILAETLLTPAAHLTCVAATRAEIDAVIEAYAQAGVRHIVALRGDPVGGIGERYAPHPGGYRNAADLVAGIKRIADLEVSVSAYPEKHPDSPSIAADIDMLKAKVDAGATRAMTQFFFENSLYFRYLDRVRAAGIDIPIVPGILPVQNFKQTKNFAARTGASIPAWLAERFDGLDDDPATRKLIAAAVAAEQVIDLVDHGVTDFHFYTMNRADLVYAICHLLGLRPDVLDATRPHSQAREGARVGDEQIRTALQIRSRAAPPRRRAHSRARRRHGHDDPGARSSTKRAFAARASTPGTAKCAATTICSISAAAGRGARHPPRIFPRRRRHRLDQYVFLDPHRAGRLRHGRDRLGTERRRRAARPRSGAARPGRGRPRALRRRRARPDQPHRLDLAGRLQSRLSRHHLRRIAARLCRAGARPSRRRRRCAADRDDLRHAQRQGRDFRHRRRARNRAASPCR